MDTDTAATIETAAPANEGWEWALVEIMGHRTHWGRVREEERFGTKMLRVDVPSIERKPAEVEGGEPIAIFTWSTHYYGGASIFSFTLTDEATVMKRNTPYEPPHRLTYREQAEPDFSEVDEVIPAPGEDDDEFD
jgi:hypothetical protein